MKTIVVVVKKKAGAVTSSVLVNCAWLFQPADALALDEIVAAAENHSGENRKPRAFCFLVCESRVLMRGQVCTVPGVSCGICFGHRRERESKEIAPKRERELEHAVPGREREREQRRSFSFASLLTLPVSVTVLNITEIDFQI